jgi:hypothetical protein
MRAERETLKALTKICYIGRMAYVESDQKTCTKCGIPKFVRDFHRKIVNGRTYPRTRCRGCENKLRCQRETKGALRQKNKNTYERTKRERWARSNQAKFVYLDARGSDRKHGRDNDLTVDFVREAIKKGCAYCGVSRDGSVMSLDRIDMTRGHLQENVIAACDNCNLTRGTMPYAAWAIVAKAVRKARAFGLLAGWNRRNRRR